MESFQHDSEESQYFETRYVVCSGPDETQIVEEAGVSLLCFFFAFVVHTNKSFILGFISHFQREVVLFLETKNGKVKGAESTPFELPSRWNFETMQIMIKDHVQVTTGKEIVINQLYFKKRGRTKAIVAVKETWILDLCCGNILVSKQYSWQLT